MKDDSIVGIRIEGAPLIGAPEEVLLWFHLLVLRFSSFQGCFVLCNVLLVVLHEVPTVGSRIAARAGTLPTALDDPGALLLRRNVAQVLVGEDSLSVGRSESAVGR